MKAQFNGSIPHQCFLNLLELSCPFPSCWKLKYSLLVIVGDREKLGKGWEEKGNKSERTFFFDNISTPVQHPLIFCPSFNFLFHIFQKATVCYSWWIIFSLKKISLERKKSWILQKHKWQCPNLVNTRDISQGQNVLALSIQIVLFIDLFSHQTV